MIRTCLFDMGNVLVHFCHDRMCRQIGALCGQTGPEIRKLLFDSELQWKFERGRLSEREFHAELSRLVAAELAFEALVEAGSDIFQLNEPIVPILETLKAQGKRLVLLSNTSVSHFEFVKRRFDVLRHFDDYVLSYEVGALKPELEIFEAALRKIGCAPQECFYTDDIAAYIAAAREHGLEAEVFTTAEALRGHLATRGVEV
ncbi:MAG TPA: HAD family phosphatase [Planctomycetaceae bacterium]|nr:HAD family phosphatase [Planctomycetaceae bacterium]